MECSRFRPVITLRTRTPVTWFLSQVTLQQGRDPPFVSYSQTHIYCLVRASEPGRDRAFVSAGTEALGNGCAFSADCVVRIAFFISSMLVFCLCSQTDLLPSTSCQSVSIELLFMQRLIVRPQEVRPQRLTFQLRSQRTAGLTHPRDRR